MKTKPITYLSLGTNQGNKEENLQKAIYHIAENVGDVQKISSIYKTPSWGFAGNDFYNICIQVSTNLSPEKLIASVLHIEKELGRQRKITETYENRSIDIDVLLFEEKIIVSKNITVPHPKMLERKFVLVPLAEIAPTSMHPITKKTISVCLQNCTDTSDIMLVKKNLQRPVPLLEKYNYIVIEGNIGAGKTSLTTMIANDFNAKLVLEQFADNPFLPKFYKDKERYAFPLEMQFLADRHQQLTADLTRFDVFKKGMVSDYYVLKSLIFAQITLQNEEFLLYKKIFDILYKEITKPDLFVYLHQKPENLLENIKKRGRAYEQNIEVSYLTKIQNGYSNFMQSQKKINTLIIDVSELDFVNNISDYYHIIDKINHS